MNPAGRDAIAAAADLATLRALLSAALDAAFDEFRRNLWAAKTPQADTAARREWEDRRRELHGAFARRLEEIRRGGG